MRAQRRGRLIYTETGPGARKAKPTKSPNPQIGLPVRIEPAAVKQSLPRPPESLCPHGGIYLSGLPICQKCRGQEDKDLIGIAMLKACYRAAKQIKVLSSTLDDCAMTAMIELSDPRNEKKILTARSPDAMAMMIAKRAIMKLFRQRSVKALPAGQFSFPDKGMTINTRLEWLDAHTGEGIVAKTTRIDEEFSEECLDRIKTIPGVDLLWTSENIQWVRNTIDEARASLPTKPFSYWLVIDMALGLSPDMDDEMSWDDIARTLSSSGRVVEEWEVQAAYRRGRKIFKTTFLEKLRSLKPFESVK